MSDPTLMPTRFDNRVARQRAKLARFISAAFSDADLVSLARSTEDEVKVELLEAAAAVGVERQLVEAVFDSVRDANADRDAYTRLFGHTVRSDCPPYELEYRSREVFQQSQSLADIAGFYRAFGCRVSAPAAEREDHVAAEWEFLALVSMMAALASCDENLNSCVEAQRAFLEDHAATWMPAFFERIRKADATSYLARTADLAEAVLRQWCAELDVPVGPQWLELRPITDEDSTITCGAPGAVELGPTLAAAMETGA